MSETGIKHDSGKPRFSLLPLKQIESVMSVLEFGARKYTIVETNDISAIGKNIEGALCQKFQNVKCAVRLKESSQKISVAHVIENKIQSEQYAQHVQNYVPLARRQGSAGLATKSEDWTQDLLNWKQKESIGVSTVNDLNLERGKKKDKKSVARILSTSESKNSIVNSETFASMVSLLSNTTFYAKEVAPFAEVQNAHTLTTTIQLEDLEICFAVIAIKPSDCYEILQTLLKNCINTSINTSDFFTIKSGVGNWQKVENPRDRYFDAAMRHVFAWRNGEKLDTETQLPHLAHAVCCLLFLMWGDDQK